MNAVEARIESEKGKNDVEIRILLDVMREIYSAAKKGEYKAYTSISFYEWKISKEKIKSYLEGKDFNFKYNFIFGVLTVSWKI